MAKSVEMTEGRTLPVGGNDGGTYPAANFLFCVAPADGQSVAADLFDG